MLPLYSLLFSNLLWLKFRKPSIYLCYVYTQTQLDKPTDIVRMVSVFKIRIKLENHFEMRDLTSHSQRNNAHLRPFSLISVSKQAFTSSNIYRSGHTIYIRIVRNNHSTYICTSFYLIGVKAIVLYVYEKPRFRSHAL